MLFAQSNEDRSRAQRIDSTNRAQGVPQTGTSSNSGSTSVAKSDTGAQRPVKLTRAESPLTLVTM